VRVEEFQQLLSPRGQRLLIQAATAYDDDGPLRAAERLATRHSADLVSLALTQVALRRRAEPKFGPAAARMYFTSEGLQQATSARVAEHRAARIAAARPSSVLDCSCGIGGDLLALGRAGLTAGGVDIDPARAAVAEANLEVLGVAGAVRVGDATALDLSAFGLVFADPSRRTERGRTFDVADYSPAWSFVTELLRRPACVKVGPGIRHDVVPAGVEAEWVSLGGEVKEAALWSPYLATARRRATVIHANGLATLTEEDDPGVGSVRSLGRWLYEPDGAVIRAGLVTAVADRVGGGLIDSHIAYVVADTSVDTAFARRYQVLEALPYREKTLRAALRERDVGTITIKKRGVDVVPEDLRKRLALTGRQEATVVLTRARGRGVALLVQPS
jgi:hypothetical protein